MPANTLDQDLSTRWSARGDGQWIAYDLGSPQMINEVRIAWHRGDERQAHFDLEVSLDASTWTEVLSASSSGSTLALQPYHFEDVSARYVRIVGHGNTENDWNSITEVEIIDSSNLDLMEKFSELYGGNSLADIYNTTTQTPVRIIAPGP